MKSSRRHCADCSTPNLVVPVQRVCIICETPQPRLRCTPCAVLHADRNLHAGVAIVDGRDGPAYRKAAA